MEAVDILFSFPGLHVRKRTSEHQLQNEKTDVEGNLKDSYLATYQPGVPDLQRSLNVIV